MTIIIIMPLLAMLIPLSVITIYYMILAIVSFAIPGTSSSKRNERPKTRFAIVIPAHNEEETILKTISSLNELSYPKDKYRIVAVADNCSDNTAKIAESCGATVLERENEQLRGKGYALSFAFERILDKETDAVIVLDADCRMDQGALSVFDDYISRGHSVLQANDIVLNPDDSAMTFALAVGNFIENNLFYAPKSKAKLSVFLRGTGMVFHSSILKKIPWNAMSLAEDVDYTLSLIRERIPITFIREVNVASNFPATQEQLQTQRNRWAKGNMSLTKLNALSCLLNGIRSKNIRLADAGLTLLALSRPLILLMSGISVFLSLILLLISCSFLHRMLFSLSILISLLLTLYLCLGIYCMGLNRKRLSYLARTPFIVLRLLAITLKGMIHKTQERWIKTPR